MNTLTDILSSGLVVLICSLVILGILASLDYLPDMVVIFSPRKSLLRRINRATSVRDLITILETAYDSGLSSEELIKFAENRSRSIKYPPAEQSLFYELQAVLSYSLGNNKSAEMYIKWAKEDGQFAGFFSDLGKSWQKSEANS